MKILIVGQPKSGTSMLAGRIKSGLDDHYRVNSQFLFEPRGSDWVAQLKSPNVTKILYSSNPRHLSEIDAMTEVGQLFDKKVIICRDPRDVIISDTLYRWFQGHNPKEEHFQKALSLVLRKEIDPSSVPLYEISSIKIQRGSMASLDKYEKLIKKEYDRFSEDASYLKSKGWCLVKYENIISEQVESLNQYLEFEIAKDITFQKKAFLRTARSKTYGNWKNWLTEKDVDFFKPVLNNSLEKLGYMKDDWELNPKPYIDPETSSEYMKKLFKGDKSFGD